MSREDGRTALGNDATKLQLAQENTDPYWRLSRSKIDFNRAAHRTVAAMEHPNPLEYLEQVAAGLETDFPSVERGVIEGIDDLGKALSSVVRRDGDIFSNGNGAPFDMGIAKPVNYDGRSHYIHIRERAVGRFAATKYHVRVPKIGARGGVLEVGLGRSLRSTDDLLTIKLKPIVLKTQIGSTYVYVPHSLRDGFSQPEVEMEAGKEPMGTDNQRVFLDKQLMVARIIVDAMKPTEVGA